MFHPSKPWRRGLSAILNDHLTGAILRDTALPITYALNPLDYAANATAGDPLKGGRGFVSDQRASGLNAVLWRDPSMIL